MTLNATFRKVVIEPSDPAEFISRDTVDNDTFRTAFTDLKRKFWFK